MDKKKCTAIILAAGQGKRMGTKVQKQFLNLGGKPVLWYALYAFENSPVINDIILVTGADLVEYCQREIVEKYGFCKVRSVTAGGAERYHSVWKGLCAMGDKENRIVFIHDGARPFVENGYIASTPKRSLVWQIQTPQVFDAELIVSAYREVIEREQELLSQGVQITDDAMVVEYVCEHPVKLVQGSYENMKLTTPDDLEVAEAFLQKRL